MSAPRIDGHTGGEWGVGGCADGSWLIQSNADSYQPPWPWAYQHGTVAAIAPRDNSEVNARLLALAKSAPHLCDVPGCPGPENAWKLELFDELVREHEEDLVSLAHIRKGLVKQPKHANQSYGLQQLDDMVRAKRAVLAKVGR
jgi:hypothetical protein